MLQIKTVPIGKGKEQTCFVHPDDPKRRLLLRRWAGFIVRVYRRHEARSQGEALALNPQLVTRPLKPFY
jgi:hypothetical protein